MSAGSFLADINNEVLLPTSRNGTYANNLSSLQYLVLVLFQQDQTVVPKESAWFGSQTPVEEYKVLSSPTSLLDACNTPLLDSQHHQRPLRDGRLTSPTAIVPMRQQPLYVDDYIGLRSLDERGAIVFATCPGKHMELTGCWNVLVEEWVGQPFPS